MRRCLGVRCDRFEIQIALVGDDLSVRVDTDLPETAVAFVTVSRGYREVGSSERYSCEYLKRQVTVAEARAGISTSIADDLWVKNLRAKQAEMAGHGLGFQVDGPSIGGAIDVSVVVHQRQKDPAFGPNNGRLIGSAVEQTGTGRVVRAERTVPRPFSGKLP